MVQRFGSKRRLAAVALMSVAAVLGAGYAYGAITTTNNQYTGCLKAGQLYNVAVGTAPTSACIKTGTQISWSQTGPQGTSVVATALTVGDTNCPTGGTSFAVGTLTTYACNGAKGDKGDKGDNGDTGQTGAPGPANLAALQGSACTFSGHTSTLSVSVNSTSGAVSMICNPVYEVSATVTGGSMHTIFLDDNTDTNYGGACGPATSCSTLMPAGHDARVRLTSTTGSFSYTCPGGNPQTATFDARHNLYQGQCETASLSGDYAVTAAF
jgi:hypothetical protein